VVPGKLQQDLLHLLLVPLLLVVLVVLVVLVPPLLQTQIPIWVPMPMTHKP
jgi:hypothetical protein